MARNVCAGGTGMCRKKPIGFSTPSARSSSAERDQVIVVHPDDVVGLQQRLERAREALVDVDVALVVAGLELREVEPVVKHRPQHGVGIAEVVLVVLCGLERQGRDWSAAGLGEVGRGAQLLAAVPDLAAPAEPEAVCARARCRPRRRRPRRPGSLTEIGDAIGDEYDARQCLPPRNPNPPACRIKASRAKRSGDQMLEARKWFRRRIDSAGLWRERQAK